MLTITIIERLAVLLLSAPPYVLHARALPGLQGHQHLPRPRAHEQPRVLPRRFLARPKAKRRSLRFACVKAPHDLVPLKRTIAAANAAAARITSITCTVACTADTADTPQKPSPAFGNVIGYAATAAAATTAVIIVIIVIIISRVSRPKEARVEASATALLVRQPPPPRQRAVSAPRVAAANGTLDVARVRAVDDAVALALADRVEGVLVQAVVRRRRRPTVPLI
jgi:hypothetical protein